MCGTRPQEKKKGGISMKIGEIVELLIGIKDNQQVMSREEEALIEACNLLARLPRLQEAKTYSPEAK